MDDGDWPAVRDIYLEGIATGQATFETQAPSWEQWDQGHLPICRLVARVGAEVLGWVALSPVSRRPVYAGVAEISIYVAERARGAGIGRSLLAALCRASEREGIWSLQAGIFRENSASIALHRRSGFREIGHQERKGSLNGVWLDVVPMERRSKTAGL